MLHQKIKPPITNLKPVKIAARDLYEKIPNLEKHVSQNTIAMEISSSEPNDMFYQIVSRRFL